MDSIQLEPLLEAARGLTTLEWFHLVEAMVLVLATWVAYRQLKLLRRQMQEEHLKARRDRALEYSIARSPHLRDVRTAVDTAFDPERWRNKTIPQKEITAVLDKHPGLETQLISLLAHWENLALTVYSGVTDEDMAREMVAGTLVEYVDRFREFIHYRQAKENKRLYEYLVRLAGRWRRQLDRQGNRPTFA